MNEYKITYTYTTPRGVMVEGTYIIQAKNEKHAKTLAQWREESIVVLSIKRAKN